MPKAIGEGRVMFGTDMDVTRWVGVCGCFCDKGAVGRSGGGAI
ncbi:hypothetical protein [Saccharicrinis sp. 156]